VTTVNTHSNDRKPSRRSFTRSIATWTVGLPLLSSLAGAQQKSRQPSYHHVAQVTKPTIVPCDSEGGTLPHEPPIGIEGGSLIVDVPKTNKISVVSSVPDDDRPYKHTLGSARYLGIQEAKVVTRAARRVFYTRYQLPLNAKYQLRIWLVQLKPLGAGNELEDQYENIASGAKPSLVLKPTGSQIETTHPLRDVGLSHKHNVPYRYEYPPHGRHFRIGRWQITDDMGNVVKNDSGTPFNGEGHDSYQIYIGFYHV
jgi:hypothetical protein